MNAPKDDQLNVAKQNMSPHRVAEVTQTQQQVVSPPPDETCTWHCRSHARPTINPVCLHCLKWTTPTTQFFVDTIDNAEPRSVFYDILVNHFCTRRDSLTAAEEAAMTTYAARHNLDLPIEISAALTTLHASNQVITHLGPRPGSASPTTTLPAAAPGIVHVSDAPRTSLTAAEEDIPPARTLHNHHRDHLRVALRLLYPSHHQSATSHP